MATEAKAQEKTIPVLTLEGIEKLGILNDLLQEIPNRYQPQLQRIFSYLDQNTQQVPISKLKKHEPEQQ